MEIIKSLKRLSLKSAVPGSAVPGFAVPGLYAAVSKMCSPERMGEVLGNHFT